MQSKKFWFTLIELLISISIISILIVILFRAYNTISQVTFRSQQEKNIQQEMIRISQILQNISDNHSIDFEKYNWELNNNESLFLSWKLWKISINSTWICRSNNPEITWFNQDEKDNPCQLIITNQDWSISEITTTSESFISKPYFTIVPTEPNQQIISTSDQDWPPPFLKIRQPGFQVNFSIYTPLYQKWDRIKMSHILFQQFFNLQK